jgi:clan AA aspartic protease
MPRETGWVNSSLEAIVSLRFSNGVAYDFIVDTGFDGALVLPRPIVKGLGLTILSIEPVKLAKGITEMESALAKVFWLGKECDAQALITEDEYLLLGTELLKGTRLTIDYIALTVSIDL